MDGTMNVNQQILISTDPRDVDGGVETGARLSYASADPRVVLTPSGDTLSCSASSNGTPTDGPVTITVSGVDAEGRPFPNETHAISVTAAATPAPGRINSTLGAPTP